MKLMIKNRTFPVEMMTQPTDIQTGMSGRDQ